MYYLYQHIRDDTGEVFYVGIGNSRRPKEKSKRSKYWNNIINKTSYTIEVVRRFETWDEACEWERLFISIYGRRDNNTGTLVNLTDGGDGSSGSKQSPSSISKRINSSSYRSYTIDAYDSTTREYLGTFLGYANAARSFGVSPSSVRGCINGKQYVCNGISFSIHGQIPDWDNIERLINNGRTITGMDRFKRKIGKPIIQYSINDGFINEYVCVADASRALGLNKHAYVSIISCANNKRNQVTAYGFKWKWKQ